MRNRRQLQNFFIYLGTLAAALIALFPPVWGTLSSFTPTNRVGGELDLENWTLDNYRAVMGQHDFWTSLAHSAIVSISTTAVAIFLGILAAFGLTRFRTRFRRLAFGILAVRMVPGIVLVLPFYLLYRNLDLLDTLHGLGLTYLTFALPFAIWMISGFFESIPFEVEEAAALDGASNWMILWRILVPIAAPAILTTAVLTFIFCWNDFLFALILTSQDALTFLPLLLRYVLPQGPLYGQIFAGATLFRVPPLIGLVLIRRHLSTAFGLGAVK
jgi:ABC-type glycerol-3-phosphate transport system permease component